MRSAHYKTVTLAMRKAGSDPKSGPGSVYRFGTVFTTKVSWESGEDTTEKITFVYGTLEVNTRCRILTAPWSPQSTGLEPNLNKAL